MKRVTFSVLALVACIAVGVSALAFADTKRVNTKVNLKYVEDTNPADPYYDESATFKGKVKAKKNVCKKRRVVKVKPGIGKDKTNKRGRYSITLADPAAPGDYRAKVKKKVVRKGGNKIVCKKAKSKVVTVS